MKTIDSSINKISNMDIRKQHTQESYAAIASLYTADFEEKKVLFDKFIDPLVSNLIENNLKNTVIDLGVGPGNIIDYLLKFDIKNKIIGVDFVQEFCDYLKIKYLNNLNIEIINDDFIDYVAKQPNNSVSAYTANYSIIHILDEEIDVLMSNIKRSLQKNGMVVFSVYEGTKKGMELEPYQTGNDSRLKISKTLESYSNNFTEEEIKEKFISVGLTIVKIQKFQLDSVPGEYNQPEIWILAQK